jgi:hypothetical protein
MSDKENTGFTIILSAVSRAFKWIGQEIQSCIHPDTDDRHESNNQKQSVQMFFYGKILVNHNHGVDPMMLTHQHNGLGYYGHPAPYHPNSYPNHYTGQYYNSVDQYHNDKAVNDYYNSIGYSNEINTNVVPYLMS